MRMNGRMRYSLGEALPSEFAEGENLNEKLSKLLAHGFLSIDGAIVFTAMRNTANRVSPDNFPDLTGLECFVNHVHVEDFVDGSVQDTMALLRQGIKFALSTKSDLRASFPGKSFQVILAASEGTCGVRFHLSRAGEAWLSSDLDGYTNEAILVLET